MDGVAYHIARFAMNIGDTITWFEEPFLLDVLYEDWNMFFMGTFLGDARLEVLYRRLGSLSYLLLREEAT